MNFPVWDVSIGEGLLIAIVSITHVFVSHFAVGGGLFLVITEIYARRNENHKLLNWLQRHTKFFVLVTVVFGAISGVGIWVTIALVHPSATSALIHTYVWGWATEWVFFFLEITASLLYLYGWNRLNPKTHEWFGWIYFISAFMSMVIINGIITFMITSGDWPETHNFWDGFFNPTYFPSLAIRFVFSLALAGIYALLTGSLQKDEELKGQIVRWSTYWIIPTFILLPFIGMWYIQNLPVGVWNDVAGRTPTPTRYFNLIRIFGVITFVLALFPLLKPRKTHFLYAIAIFLSAYVTMWSFEFIRESLRKPYVIYGYMYANSVYESGQHSNTEFLAENIEEKGVLQVARWVQNRNIENTPPEVIGREIFRVECQSCHTPAHYRGVQKFIQQRQWTFEILYPMLDAIDLMHNGIMPPFVGTDEEQKALAQYLMSLVPQPKPVPKEGAKLFQSYCGACHLPSIHDRSIAKLRRHSVRGIVKSLEHLPKLFIRMPDLPIPEEERMILAQWIKSLGPTTGK